MSKAETRPTNRFTRNPYPGVLVGHRAEPVPIARGRAYRLTIYCSIFNPAWIALEPTWPKRIKEAQDAWRGWVATTGRDFVHQLIPVFPGEAARLEYTRFDKPGSADKILKAPPWAVDWVCLRRSEIESASHSLRANSDMPDSVTTAPLVAASAEQICQWCALWNAMRQTAQVELHRDLCEAVNVADSAVSSSGRMGILWRAWTAYCTDQKETTLRRFDWFFREAAEFQVPASAPADPALYLQGMRIR